MRQKDKDRKTWRYGDRKTERQKGKKTDTDTENRQTDRHSGIERKTEGQTTRQRDRQRDRPSLSLDQGSKKRSFLIVNLIETSKENLEKNLKSLFFLSQVENVPIRNKINLTFSQNFAKLHFLQFSALFTFCSLLSSDLLFLQKKKKSDFTRRRIFLYFDKKFIFGFPIDNFQKFLSQFNV